MNNLTARYFGFDAFLKSRNFILARHIYVSASSRSYLADESCKKPTKLSIPKGYNVAFVESDWYKWWNEKDFFNHPSNKSEFVMCLPPPNVTGNLHIGHALTVAVEDTYLRWRRMLGERCFWIPGFDHAGIATQIVVEKLLLREKGLKRQDMTRKEFVEHCLLWKQQRVAAIRRQLERLGASLDWNRCFYTMDEKFSDAVFHAFRSLYEQNLIFRDRRLVSWSPFLQSTLSDIEIENKSIDEPIKYSLPGNGNRSVDVGWMFYVDYELYNDSSGSKITVATTRPETIPADVALAVHPADERFGSFVGKFVRNPLLKDHVIPIVADNQLDPLLGTGVLKLTPGHDRTDFEIGKRHNLVTDLNIFNDDGTISADCLCPPLRGLDRFEARLKVVEILRSNGLLVDRRPHATILPVCGRTGDIVESVPKNQWFLDTRRMADDALRALECGELRVYPEFFAKQMKPWLEKSTDWCLSRQLWWGHRLPVFRVEFDDSGDRKIGDEFLVSRDESSAYKLAAEKYNDRKIKSVVQETDVLDTWFSSSLVPLVVNGWPAANLSRPDSQSPLNLMETGHDILGFWVTRMIMLGLHFTGRLPFKDVLLHGIVRDAQSRKMSKSLGNVIDPIDVIEGKSLQALHADVDGTNFPQQEKLIAKKAMSENFPKGIPECGADALRFSLLLDDVKVHSLNIDVVNIENKRHFCNKIWQSFNYMKRAWTLETIERITDFKDQIFQSLSYEDKWILSRLSNLVECVNFGLQNYEFHLASKQLFNFWWHEFCDLYLEYSKPFVWKEDCEDLARIGRIFSTVSDVFLRLLAPFMPFLTEEAHNWLPNGEEKHLSIHQRPFPLPKQVDFSDPDLDKSMEYVKLIINGVRSLKKDFGIPLNRSVEGVIRADQFILEAADKFNTTLTCLAKLSCSKQLIGFVPMENENLTRNYLYFMVAENCHLYIKMDDADRNLVLNTVEKQIEKRRKSIENLQKRVARSARLNKLSGGKVPVAPAEISDDIDKLNGEIDRLSKTLAQIRA